MYTLCGLVHNQNSNKEGYILRYVDAALGTAFVEIWCACKFGGASTAAVHT